MTRLVQSLGSRDLKQNSRRQRQQAEKIEALKGPSRPPPFSMPSKLLILHGEVKSECFTTSCVPESSFNYL